MLVLYWGLHMQVSMTHREAGREREEGGGGGENLCKFVNTRVQAYRRYILLCTFILLSVCVNTCARKSAKTASIQ